MLPPKIPKKPKRESRCCAHCNKPLMQKPAEGPAHFARRRFCDKFCSAQSNSPYASRSERLLQNCEPADANGCWNWTGYRDRKGYGRVQDIASGEVLAHRVSFIEFRGAIPEGLHILHSCDNPACINPAHLRAGTNDDNMRDRLERNRCFKPRGERNPRAKITTADVLAIRASSAPRQEVARQYGINEQSVSNIRLGKTWKHV